MKSQELGSFLAAAMVAALLVVPALPAFAGDDEDDRDKRHAANRALVGVSDFSEAEEVIEDAGGRVRNHFRSSDVVVVETPIRAADWVEEFRREVAAEDSLDYVQLDFIVSADTHADDAYPNDDYWSSLYGMQKIGVEQAWDVTKGSKSVVVGVIDTGIDYMHPDLQQQMWVNPDEVAGNGLDDDRNGWVDDVHGIDCINNDGNPMDDNNHGTHVAGTIAATANDDRGVAGIANASLMALKFLGSSGSGSISNAIECLDYAIKEGAHLTNNSWGGGGYSSGMYSAIQRAQAAGQLFLAAAGNSAADTDSSPHYPASYNLDNIISVAATDKNDALASFSNYGPNTVDIAAPGVSIHSTVRNGGYSNYNGTSMATPHVAGAAALLLAKDPTAGWASLKSLLFEGADALGNLAGKMTTGARLNIAASIGPADPPPPPVVEEPPADVAPGAPTELTATAGTGGIALSWKAPSDLDIASYSVYRSEAGADSGSKIGTSASNSFTDTAAAGGSSYDYRVSATDTAGNEGAQSATATATMPTVDTTAPAAPQGVTATAGTNQVTLQWENNGETDLAGYRIYRRSGSGASSYLATSTDASFIDQAVTAGTTYHYVVSAFDADNNESVKSSEVSAVPQAPRVLQKKSLVPSRTAIVTGSLYRGSVSDLATDNGRYYTIGGTRPSGSRTYTAEWEAITTLTGVSSPTKLSLTYNGRVSSSYATHKVTIYNETTDAWETLYNSSGSSRDRTVTWSAPTAADYLSASGEVRVRVQTTRTSYSVYSYGDLIRFDVEYY